MQESDFVFTSEAVLRGHPDKLCDQISDGIVGSFMRQDRLARVVAECAVSTGILFLSVKFGSKANVDVASVARRIIEDVGYTSGEFVARKCTVMTSLIEHPLAKPGLRRDEARLSEQELDQVLVNDQATVIGFACTHTSTLMPAPVWLANQLARRLDGARECGELPFLAPDGKVQVAVEFSRGVPRRVHALTVVVAQRERGSVTIKQLDEAVREHVIKPVFEYETIQPDGDTRIDINPEGPVIGGGPYLHAGLTAHKGGADTYGGFARQSTSGLSGKDPSRIDRVGDYAARHAAKAVVAAGLSEHCEVQLSYTIGLPGPVSVHVETFGTGRIPDGEISRRVQRHLDFRLGAIVRRFQMRELPSRDDLGFFPRLAAYGHVGRSDLELPWEDVAAAAEHLKQG